MIDYSKLTLQELLDHTERIIRLMAQNLRDELRRLEDERKHAEEVRKQEGKRR